MQVIHNLYRSHACQRSGVASTNWAHYPTQQVAYYNTGAGGGQIAARCGFDLSLQGNGVYW